MNKFEAAIRTFEENHGGTVGAWRNVFKYDGSFIDVHIINEPLDRWHRIDTNTGLEVDGAAVSEYYLRALKMAAEIVREALDNVDFSGISDVWEFLAIVEGRYNDKIAAESDEAADEAGAKDRLLRNLDEVEAAFSLHMCEPMEIFNTMTEKDPFTNTEWYVMEANGHVATEDAVNEYKADILAAIELAHFVPAI